MELPVAIGAENHALFYLSQQIFLRAYGRTADGEVLLRGVEMVEVQHLGPCLAAFLTAEFKAAEKFPLLFISSAIACSLTRLTVSFVALNTISNAGFLKLAEGLLGAACLAYFHRARQSIPFLWS